MKAIFLLVYSVACVGASAGAGRADDRPPLAYGAVFNGRVFAVQDDAAILEVDWRGEEPQDRRREFFPIAVAGDFPARWKIGFGALVMTLTDVEPLPRGMRTRDIKTASMFLGEDVREFYLPGLFGDPWRDSGWNNNLIAYLYENMRDYVNYRDHVYDEKYPFSHYEFFFDLAPQKLGACRYFVLASESLQTGIEETRRRYHGKSRLKEPTQPFSVDCESRWDLVKDPLKPMLGVWLKDKDNQWQMVDKIKDPCFNEGFHVFVQGDDWYFVTDSGKVFLSRKPDKDGGERKLEAVWDDAKRPIVAAVTDADADKTFLFGRPSDEKAKPFYFALAEKPQPAEFDAGAIKAPRNAAELKAPEPLKTVLAYAHFLVDEKQIKLPDKTDKDKEK